MTTFTEPVSAPGTGTMYTLDEIMAAIPEVSASGAVSTEVRADKTFWGLNAGEWGSQTGKLYGGCHCEGGTLNGTRWCDNDDGTITDLLGYNGVGQCLVWQKDADCNTLLAGINKTDNLDWADAVVWSSAIQSGVCSLTDSSVEGDWRLPTKEELYALLHGTEAVSLASPRAFTNISVTFYWSSTTYANNNTYAWAARPYDAFMYSGSKLSQSFDVLPVRGGQ